ncbi:MAG: hypothetical protein ABEJ59_02850 [Halanaeroarchaeum sp.]
MRRNLLAVLVVAALVLAAGCTAPPVGQQQMRVEASSHGAAVGDFETLRVTVTEVGVYSAEAGAWNTTTTKPSG